MSSSRSSRRLGILDQSKQADLAHPSANRTPPTKSRSTEKDDKERYLTYSITVRAADKAKEIKEEVVTKKMPNFNEGGPKDFLDWAYHFSQLAKLKHWNTEDKFLNANILLEGGFLEAFEDAAFTDDDTRMDEEFTRALRKASIAVLPVDYSETIQEELWEMSKSRSETLADYSKRFRALVRQEHTLARLHEASPMCEDALCRLYKRGLPYDWQNKVKDASIDMNLKIAGVTNPTAGTPAFEATTEAMVINNSVVAVVDVVVVAAEAAVVVATATATAPTARTTTSTAPSIARIRTTLKTVEHFITTINRRNTSKLTSSVACTISRAASRPVSSNASTEMGIQVTKNTCLLVSTLSLTIRLHRCA
ncbi:hypothetical protein PF010_g25979 [Phytophthora fragariae]|uniref:Retrotransposon gag domain-containing protein n=1 Tax=Phytophthora fragariae TaxID=53985 RepID=A0A6G0JZ01_9STRA|nr:hypothetical protein PF010_g25979 [Phytophthora fragariae]